MQQSVVSTQSCIEHIKKAHSSFRLINEKFNKLCNLCVYRGGYK